MATEITGSIELRVRAEPYDERFLRASWDWLRDSDVSRLTMTPPFTQEQQRKWFDSLAHRPDYLIWGVALDGVPIGAFGIKSIRDGVGEYWGYIGKKDYWGKGIGRWMLDYVLDAARRHGLVRLELRVLRDNERAIRLYQRFRFYEREDPRNDESMMWMERSVE